MTEPKWTPGPWRAMATREGVRIETETSTIVACGISWVPNARLIAAAPELYEALTEARQYVADAGNDEDGETQTHSAALLAEIDAVLAKARGET